MTTTCLFLALGLAALAFLFLYLGKGYLAWVLPCGLGLLAWRHAGVSNPQAFLAAFWIFVAAAALLGFPPLRALLVTRPIMSIVAGILPKMGETERIALEAGTVWWDAELFSGSPDWKKMFSEKAPALSEKEKAFMAGPVQALCEMLDDWRVSQERDLPPEVWDFIKKNKFWGMIIPEAHGGLGFSALCHSAVITKLSSRSVTAAVTVMVPNSLGPGELILHYGTDEQKKYWLPRLASGQEIPCFALTEPEAGSDAASIKSGGVVCKGTWEGKEVVGIRLNWSKRYITLAPVATVLGLAFKLHDPEKLLGGAEELGITCALLPANMPGVEIGRRHDPLGIPFHNGPTTGKDVFVPLDFIVGGRAMAGQGWRMLMDCLAAGRSISLPSLSVGASQLAARAASAHAEVRRQFGLSIGKFEGIEAPLARIAGMTYLMNAARVVTAGAVDAGQKPSVVSAIVKAYCTEGMRSVLSDAMDVQAGNAICKGPHNTLGKSYCAVPIGITVEGANILTRSMIIFGQGAIRCHPFAKEEMAAVAAHDLGRFDAAFFGHVNFVFHNAARALVQGLAAPLCHCPESGMNRMSAAFAVCAEGAMATLGGQLKRRELLSGRLADALAWLYLGTATLKDFHDRGKPAKERIFLDWSIAHCLHQAESALAGLLDNLPSRPAAFALRQLVFPIGPVCPPPSDRLGAKLAQALLGDEEIRNRLTADIYIPGQMEGGLGLLDAAYRKTRASAELEKKAREAVKAGKPVSTVLTAEEAKLVEEADALRREAIQVDAFDKDVFRSLRA